MNPALTRSLCLLLASTLLTPRMVAQAPPSAAELGVPAYPGATYDAQKSKGMSSAEEKYYVFASTDALQKVVAFYESQTKHKGTPIGDAVLIVLEGQAPFPTHGVMIEPNRPELFAAPVKTVITVRREFKAKEESMPDTEAAADTSEPR